LIGSSQPERLEGWPVGLLIEELPQSGVVGILGIGDLDRLALLGEIVVSLRDIHGAHMPDGLLGRTQHGGALFHQLLRELGGRRFELFVGNCIIDHADAGCLLAVEWLAQAGIVEGVARQHHVGDRL
jgi:hypothetical protein